MIDEQGCVMRRERTFGDIYRAAVRRGDAPAYALYRAEEWQKRKERKAMSESKTQQVPSVGRVVHYVAHGSPDGTHPTGAHRAAIITEAFGDTTIASLCVLNPTGMYFLIAAPYDPTAQQPGSWHWPEFVPAR